MSHSPALTPPAAPVSRALQPATMWRRLQAANPAAPRRGFTLTELLVVIGIIAVLSAVLIPTIMSTLKTARNAAIKAEIDLLNMAMVSYQAEYGVYPPCVDEQMTATSAAGQHLKRLFPRCNVAQEFTNLNMLLPITRANALNVWLSGFTNDPRNPLTGGSRKSLFDFDKSRVTTTLEYHPSRKPDSPYIYIDAAHYGTPGDNMNAAQPTEFKIAGVTYWAEPDPTDNTFFNPDTFQILCAGSDGEWGTDDDLSNFWPATRGEYEN